MPVGFYWKDVEETTDIIVRGLRKRYDQPDHGMSRYPGLRSIYAIPRGGAVPGALLSHRLGVPMIDLMGAIGVGTLVVDDILDSGDTMERHVRRPVWGVASMVAKPAGIAKLREMSGELLPQWIIGQEVAQKDWVEFPWERTGESSIETVQANVTRMLEFIGEDITREGLVETPARVVRMWQEVFHGYKDPRPKLKTFTSKSTSMVVKTDIRAYTFCEHHLVPIILNVSFAYIPNGKVVGISKVIRLINWCCARLILQEELVEEIVNIFQDEVEPQGVACIIQGLHLCELTRGVKTQNVTTTSALVGAFKTQPETREEFLQLVKMTNPFEF